MFKKVVSGGGWSSSNILVYMDNTPGDVKTSVVTFQRTGGRGVWAWVQVRMDTVISLTQSSLILVASIYYICLKFVAGIVAMYGIVVGDEARIMTGKDLI